MASRSPLVQALLSLPGSLNSSAKQSFVQTTSNLPSQIQWGESPKPHSVSQQGFTGATTADPVNVVNPQPPATFQAPTLATSDTVNALMPSTPAAPVPSAPAALVSAVSAEAPATTGATPAPASSPAVAAPNPPVPAAASVALPGATQVSTIDFASPVRQQSTTTGEVYEGHLPTPVQTTSSGLATAAQLGKRLNPSVGASRTSFQV